MADTPSSDDRSFKALDFIAKFLTEHEQELDRLIEKLRVVTKQYSNLPQINARIDRMAETIDSLQNSLSKITQNIK